LKQVKVYIVKYAMIDAVRSARKILPIGMSDPAV